MATIQTDRCANCGSPGTKKCSGCKGAPKYSPAKSDVGYCSIECQKKHWKSQHKAHCERLRQRKKLFRVATIMKSALLTYRISYYDIDLVQIGECNKGLMLYQNLDTPLGFRPFPKHVTDNAEHRESALLKDACTQSWALLSGLVKKLLGDHAHTIHTETVVVGEPVKDIAITPTNFNDINMIHTLIKTKDFPPGDDWYIDVTGRQYGFADILIPRSKYIEDHKCVNAVDAGSYLAVTEVSDVDLLARIPAHIAKEGRLAHLESERKLRVHFLAYVNGPHVNEDLMKGTDGAFEVKLDRFLTGLEWHLLGLPAP